jgi:Flp pilus assembly protein TadG
MNRNSLIARLIRSSRGQSLVEFGMVLPFLLVVAFITTEFGRAFWVQNVITEAAGAGARAAIVSDKDQYQTKASSAADHILTANKMSIASGSVVTSDLVTEDGQTSVRVRVTRDFSFIPGSGGGGGLPTTPFAAKGNRIPVGTITIGATAIMQTQGTDWQ